MKRHCYSMSVLAFVLGALLAPRFSAASCIAISKDMDFVDCRAVIAPPFASGTVYVLANLFADIARDGCTGAEFRVDGFPAGWFPRATPNAAATATGDPLGAGCSIAFSSCQTSQSGIVLLYTITY